MGSHGSHEIPLRMGIRSAMVWERDGNGNEVHENGNYDVGVGNCVCVSVVA